MSAHTTQFPASPLTGWAARMAIRTLHDAIDAGHPDTALLETLASLAVADHLLTLAQQELRAAVIEAAANELDAWLETQP